MCLRRGVFGLCTILCGDESGGLWLPLKIIIFGHHDGLETIRKTVDRGFFLLSYYFAFFIYLSVSDDIFMTLLRDLQFNMQYAIITRSMFFF